jgi:hypothetical protein
MRQVSLASGRCLDIVINNAGVFATGAVAFLAGPDAAFITGATLAGDGGLNGSTSERLSALNDLNVLDGWDSRSDKFFHGNLDVSGAADTLHLPM